MSLALCLGLLLGPPADASSAASPGDASPATPAQAPELQRPEQDKAETGEGPGAPAAPAPTGAEPPSDAPAAPAPADSTAPAEDMAPLEAAPVVPDSTAPAKASEAPVPVADPNADPFAGILKKDEEAELPRAKGPRATGTRPGEEGVDREEALRRYYAALYRPASNPARPYFAAIAGGGLLGGNKTEVNGRWGSLDLEAGASWNNFGFALGGGISGGGIQLDQAGTANAPFGVSGLANVGLGRRAYLRRGVLDLRLGYRATYFKVQPEDDVDPSVDVAYILPHGPEIRLDVGFMVSRVREPRFFHRIGLSIAIQVVVAGGPIELPVIAAPRFGLVYAFG